MGLLNNLKNKKPLIEEAKQLVKEVYQENELPWVIGYSGGKDSTATLQVVFEALQELEAEQLTKPIYVISSDTMVENPLVANVLHKNMNQITQAAKASGLPIHVEIVKPLVNQTFWVNIIGRGYPAPNQTFRWCTDRMKIDPANRFIMDVVSNFGEAIMVLGVREGESQSRDRVLKTHTIDGKKLMRHSTLANAYVFAPIRPFTVDDVWEYLLSVPSPWGGDNHELYALYSDSNANECPLVIDENTKRSAGSCGNSRFGCWTCTVVQQDKSLTGFIENGTEWLRPLLEYRNWLAEIRDNRDLRMKRRRGGGVYFVKLQQSKTGQLIITEKLSRSKQILQLDHDLNVAYEIEYDQIRELQPKPKEDATTYQVIEEAAVPAYLAKNQIDLSVSEDLPLIVKLEDGEYAQLGLGPYTMEARKDLLKKLLELQKLIGAHIEEPLITEAELGEIRKIWFEDGEWEDLVAEIYEQVFEIPFPLPKESNPILSEAELETLADICEEMNVDFNTFKEMLKIERDYRGLKYRKVPTEKVGKLLKRDFLHV
ncbi:MAG: DNA phosphorothioation system sulfurtransferase DndC [Culicoidibacterales bacterium]